jgi:Fe2+ transport system protein FeoA
MTDQMLSCPMCGYKFDPANHAACESCPLQGGCQLVCCPHCGYEIVDVNRSRWASAAARLFSLGKFKGKHKASKRNRQRARHGGNSSRGGFHFPGRWWNAHQHPHRWRTTRSTLADVPLGCSVRVAGFSPSLNPDRRAHLQAYGLVPGYQVLVLQQSPVTVVRVENTELALECDLAEEIQVTTESN